jgi:hypothetical protein
MRDRVESRLLPGGCHRQAEDTNGSPGLPHCSSRSSDPTCPAIHDGIASGPSNHERRENRPIRPPPIAIEHPISDF